MIRLLLHKDIVVLFKKIYFLLIRQTEMRCRNFKEETTQHKGWDFITAQPLDRHAIPSSRSDVCRKGKTSVLVALIA